MSLDLTTMDLVAFVKEVHERGAMGQPFERYFALQSGWDPKEFHRLYTAYIESTQVDLDDVGNDTTGAKGNPLEVVARYFLEQGGIARNVKPGGLNNKWTVDGIGETYPDRALCVLGPDIGPACGPQLYMEAKNHADVMGPADWAQHGSRMQRHACKFGVVVSTVGYAVGGGQGYAEQIYHDWLSPKVVHALLSIADLRSVDFDGELPWSVVKTATLRQVNQSFQRREVQQAYGREACAALALAEFQRLKAA